MKASLITGIAFALLPMAWGQSGAKQQSYMSYQDHPWVDSVLSTLSMEEQAAQSRWLIVDPEDRLTDITENARAVRDHGLGGLIVAGCPGEQVLEQSAYYQSCSSLPLGIALEGSWNAQFPGFSALSSIASDSLRYLAGVNLAAQLQEKGVTMIISGGMDQAIEEGLLDMHIQVLDPEWIRGLETSAHPDSIEDRARQALALKYWIKQGDVKKSRKSGQSAFMRDLYAHSLTVLRNQDEVIPLRALEKTNIACLAVNQQELTGFQKMAGQYTRTDNYNWSPGSENSKELIKQLVTYDLVLAAVYPGKSTETTEAFLSLLGQEAKLILVWFGDAAGLEQYLGVSSNGTSWEPDGFILAHDHQPITQGLSAQLIFGGIGASGRLPVALGDQYPVGHGISTPGSLRLQYGFPENAGLNSSQLHHRVDSIVNGGLEAGAYPGCQVIIARKGIVIFQKAYGHHTYEKRIEVRNNDLYDLASVTKISGPLSGLMLLEGQGKFSYKNQLGDYCTAMKGSDKADLELKDVLAHRAGLFPWIPYHENTLKKNGTYKKRFVRTDKGEKHSIQVADRVYLSNTYKEKIFKTIRKSDLGEQKYVYSGLSFFLFPTIIEELSGQPYETFLYENIYRRLGAWELLYHPRTNFPGSRIIPTELDSVFRKQMMHGYVHDEGAALMGAYAGNAGLFASSNDLLKLIEMYRRMGYYGGEQIIQADVLKEYSSYQFPELEIRRGLGFDKPLLGERDGTPGDYPCPGAPPSSFGHSGFTGTYVWADPENEISYVFLSNRVHTTRTNQLLYEMDIRTNILQSVYDSIIDP